MCQTSTRLKSVKKDPDEPKDEAITATPSPSTNTARYTQPSINRSSLNRIPDGVIQTYLTPCLTNKDMGLFAAVSKQSRAYFHDELIQRGTQKLLEHVVKGEENLAQAMLTSNPRLLLVNSAKTVAYSGKLIEDLTPFQAALCAGDADMVKMMKPYFDKLDDGSQKMADQIHAVFRDGYDAHLDAQTEATFNFDTIFNAIAHASDDDVQIALSLSGARLKQSDEARSKPDHDLTLVEALNRFRETFSKKSLRETIYNPQHLLKALELYNTTFDLANRGQWSCDKIDLFWPQIIGFCQRFVPACTAQALTQGLHNLVDAYEHRIEPWQGQPFKRTLKFLYCEGSIYPIRSHCSGLGFNYAVAWVLFWESTSLECARGCYGVQKIYFIQVSKSLHNYIRKHHPDTGCTPLTAPAR